MTSPVGPNTARHPVGHSEEMTYQEQLVCALYQQQYECLKTVYTDYIEKIASAPLTITTTVRPDLSVLEQYKNLYGRFLLELESLRLGSVHTDIKRKLEETTQDSMILSTPSGEPRFVRYRPKNGNPHGEALYQVHDRVVIFSTQYFSAQVLGRPQLQERGATQNP